MELEGSGKADPVKNVTARLFSLSAVEQRKFTTKAVYGALMLCKYSKAIGPAIE